MLWACVLVGALRTALGLLFALCCDEAHGRMRVERTVDRLLGGASVWHAARRLVIIFFSLALSACGCVLGAGRVAGSMRALHAPT